MFVGDGINDAVLAAADIEYPWAVLGQMQPSKPQTWYS